MPVVSSTLLREPESNHDLWTRPAALEHVIRKLGPGESEVGLLVDGIRCNGCVITIEKLLMQQEGVKQIQVNAMTRRARILFDPDAISLSEILEQLEISGYSPRPLDRKALDDARRDESRDLMKRLLVAGFGMMQAMMFALVIYLDAAGEISGSTLALFRWLGFLVATPVVLYSAQPFFKGAVRGFKNRELNMDVPIGLAIGVVYLASLYQAVSSGAEVYFDSVSMLVFFLLTGRFFEMRARHRAIDNSDALARLTPHWAERLTETGHYERVATSELRPLDQVRVAEGGQLPADGTLLDHAAELDESLLSGESARQTRQVGEAVIAGSIACGGPLLLSVTQTGSDTFLSNLANLATRAQAKRPRLALAGQQTAARFVFWVLALTLLTAIGWLIVEPGRALEASLAVLVVSCPCAFALAVPAAITRTISVLVGRGILIVEPDVLENLACFDQVIFDKTGTLTTPTISSDSVSLAAGLTVSFPHIQNPADALHIAASLAEASNHPLSKALVDANKRPLLKPQRIEVEVGKGISATLGSQVYRLGRADFALNEGSDASENNLGQHLILAAHMDAAGEANQLIASFDVVETLRKDAVETIQSLKDSAVTCEIVSGDSEDRVSHIASQLGISKWHSRQLPADKLNRILSLQEQGHCILAIGDGSNDAPVLAGANVSVALASGTDLAQAHADIIFCSEKLIGLVEARSIARQALSILHQNQRWALIYNFLAIPLAALGFVPPWLAAIGMSTSSLIVVLNALRIGNPAPAKPGTTGLNASTIPATS